MSKPTDEQEYAVLEVYIKLLNKKWSNDTEDKVSNILIKSKQIKETANKISDLLDKELLEKEFLNKLTNFKDI